MNDETIKLTVLVMAGGTGGHVFPALAVANELRDRGVAIQWLGSQRGMESELIPKFGIKMNLIKISGLRGNGVLGWVFAPIKLSLAVLQCITIIRTIKPSAVLGMGGFASGPGGLAAWLLRIPLLVHEQNAVAGLTNRLLAPLAKVVMEAFPGALTKYGAIHTGNPVRSEILNVYENKKKMGGDSGHRLRAEFNLLIVGGSLGAKALNETVPQALSMLTEKNRPNVWHQTGKKHYQSCIDAYAEANVEAKVEAFIDNMAEAYQWADLVICRAGAMTVSELACSGCASILIPYPFAVDDHQTGNARYLSEAGAAILIQQSDLDAQKMLNLLGKLDTKKIQAMSEIARSKALLFATRDVADHCMEAAKA